MFKEKTDPLLRPDQIQEMGDEKRRLEGILSAPPHIANQVQNRGDLTSQLRRLERQLETQTPKPYQDTEKDAAIAREKELLDDIVRDMPTQAEMRRAPAGAVDKHMHWDKRTKEKVLEWKNIRRRRLAGGDIEGEELDVANIERYRPAGGSAEMNMHNELIPGKTYFGGGNSVVLTDDEMALLKQLLPSLADKVGLMSAAQRNEIKEALDQTVTGKSSDWNELQKRAKELGINTYGKKREQLIAEMNQLEA